MCACCVCVLCVLLVRLCHNLRLLRDARLLGQQLAAPAFCAYCYWQHAVLHQPVLLLQVNKKLLCFSLSFNPYVIFGSFGAISHIAYIAYNFTAYKTKMKHFLLKVGLSQTPTSRRLKENAFYSFLYWVKLLQLENPCPTCLSCN